MSTEGDGPASRRHGRFRKWSRIVLRVAVAVVLLVAALAATALLTLRSSSGRQFVLTGFSRVLEDRAGFRLVARDFAIRWREGKLELQELSLLASGSSRPFVEAERVEAHLSWPSLGPGSPVRIQSLTVDAPRIDLTAPLPVSSSGEGSGSRDLLIERFEAIGLAIVAPPVDGMEPLLDGYYAEGVALRGRLSKAMVELSVTEGLCGLTRGDREPIEAQLTAQALFHGDGRFEVESLHLEGPGLRFDLAAHGESMLSAPVDLSLDLVADPARLFPDLTPGGRIELTGRLQASAKRVAGDIQASVTGFPAALLRPWIPTHGPGVPDLDESWFDLESALEIDGSWTSLTRGPESLRGEVAVDWRSPAEPLLAATLRASDDPVQGESTRLTFEAELLPRDAGRRSIKGSASLDGWSAPAETRLHAVTMELDLPDVPAAARRIGLVRVADRWPGGVHGSLHVDGPLLHPHLRLDAEWLDGERRLARLSARSVHDTSTASAVRFAVVAEALPDDPAEIRIAGALAAPGWPDLALAELDDVRAVVRLGDLAATFDRLSPWLLPLVPQDGTARDVVARVGERVFGALDATAVLAGPMATPRVGVEARWMPWDEAAVVLNADGRLGPRPPYFTGRADLAARKVDLDRLAQLGSSGFEGLRGTVDASLALLADDGAVSFDISAGGKRLGFGDAWEIDRVTLEAQSDGGTVTLDTLSGRFSRTPLGARACEFEGSGGLDLAPASARAEFRLEVEGPAAGVERLAVETRLDRGLVHLDSLELTTAKGVTRVSTTVPWGLLTELHEGLAVLPIEPARGPVSITISGVRLGEVLSMLELRGPAAAVEATFDGGVALDPRDLAAASGTLSITDLAVELERGPIEAAETVRLELRGGRVTLSPTRLQPRGGLLRDPTPLDLAGWVELNQDWRLGDTPTDLLGELSLDVRGTIDVGIVNPLLRRARAAGELRVDAEARGTPETLEAHVTLDGTGASLLFNATFPTKIADPRLRLTARGGQFLIERVELVLNGGKVAGSGTFDLEDGLRLHATLDDAHYRLPLELSALLDAEVDLHWPLDGRRRLAGDVVLERGTIRQPVNVEAEALGFIFGRAPDRRWRQLQDTIDLDLVVTTVEGVRVRNNAASLRADWTRLEVGGTLATPLVTGRIEIEPGGKIFALGQAIRIDEGAFIWSGQPIAEARKVFELTSSLDDPMLRQQWRSTNPNGLIIQGAGSGGMLDFWDRYKTSTLEGGREFGWETLLATTEGFGGSVSRRTEITFQPLPVFGETNAQARLNVSQDVSPNVTFIASINPRVAEGQTYIVDVHHLRFRRSIRGQLFTTDSDRLNIFDPSRFGITLQQTHRFGGRSEQDPSPRLREVTLDLPEDVGRRGLHRAVGYRKGDPLPGGVALDVEVDVLNAMHGRGYPGAVVDVDVDTQVPRRAKIHVSVDAGPRIGFVFRGTKLPRRERKRIASVYRPAEVDERQALESVKQEAEQALRGLGYPWPEVEVTVRQTPSDKAAVPRRTVDVGALGGRRIRPDAPHFTGLPDEDARFVADRFDSLLSRVDLARASPSTDGYLLGLLASRGYPEARILSRDLSQDGKRLTVEIDSGPVERILNIEFEGVTQKSWDELTTNGDLEAGQPARRQRIRLETTRLEQGLRNRGFPDAQVTARIESLVDNDDPAVAVRFLIEPGDRVRIDSVEFEGLKGSNRKWVRRMAGLEPGDTLAADEVAAARRRLSSTGVFSHIRIDQDHGGVDQDGTSSEGADLIFKLRERSRFAVSYGARWSSNEGIGLVVDFVDHNSLGRGHTAGVRGIWGRENSLRLYYVVPRVLGPANSLELFLEGREEKAGDIEAHALDFWAQLTVPIHRRLQTRGYLRMRDRDVEVDVSDPDLSFEDRLSSPILGWQLVYSTVERGIGAQDRKGFFFGVDLSGAATALGSDLTAAATFVQLKYFLSFARHWTWAQSWRTGVTDASGQPVPIPDRLQAGGEYSVRGYPVNSLGPQTLDGIAVGGEFLFVVNQEVHRSLWPRHKLAGLVFFDAGNVWVARENVDADLFKSVGLGLRYGSPIGPLRLDLARGLDRREQDPDYKLYLGFGTVF